MAKEYHAIDAAGMTSPRYLRARRFSQQVMHLMQDFIPRDRRCLREVEEHLMEAAWINNAEIINVPLECDEFDKLKLEGLMLERAMKPIIVPKPSH